MLSNELKQLVVAPARTMILIWGAFLAASPIYVAVVWILFRGDKPEVEPPADPMMMMVGVGLVGLLSAIASVILEKVFLSEKRILKNLGQTPSAVTALGSKTQGGSAPSGEKVALFEKLSETEQRLACLLGHYQTSMMMIWAMRESIAVWGVLLAILVGKFLPVIPFAAVALMLVAIKPPRPIAFLEANRNRAQNFGGSG